MDKLNEKSLKKLIEENREFMGMAIEANPALKGNQMVIRNSEGVVVRAEDGSLHSFTWDEVREIQKEKTPQRAG